MHYTEKSIIERVAKERLATFIKSREEYIGKRPKLFHDLKPTKLDAKSNIQAVVNTFYNFSRMFKDMLLFAGSRAPGQLENLETKRVKVTVVSRNNLFTNLKFTKLIDCADTNQKRIIRNFLDRELFKEVNCTNFLLIEGLSVSQLYRLILLLGQNPKAFLSDYRGENSGRVAIDNSDDIAAGLGIGLTDGNDIAAREEREYWQPVMSGWWLRVPWIKKWYVSRTHGVVYGVRDKLGRRVILFPVHVDPKNAVVVIAELLGVHKSVTKKAMHYHISAAGTGSEYVGTGLYDLGCKIFIALLKKAQQDGAIADLEVDGEDKLETTSTIVGDRLIAERISQIAVPEQSTMLLSGT